MSQLPNDYRIIQILSAEGWYVKYQLDNDEIMYNKIICFGLVEFDVPNIGTVRMVEPMDYSDIGSDFCCDNSNFIGIEYLPSK